MTNTVFEIRNHLAIAVANVEAFTDAKLEPTPRRLRSVMQALREIDLLLHALKLPVPHTHAIDTHELR